MDHQLFFIYSAQGYPGTKQSGRHTEFCQVLGYQILLPEKERIALERRYKRPYWRNFMERGEGRPCKL